MPNKIRDCLKGSGSPNFNYGEYAIIRNQVSLNNYKISVKEWAAKTNAIGLTAKAGRYGGTYPHKDIAFEFGMWISAEGRWSSLRLTLEDSH